ncbi:MAG: pseudouridine synthase [Verrucomicrobia bacterium]|nr:pseudouridine synthase [Verrucomicrobiota bacterium]
MKTGFIQTQVVALAVLCSVGTSGEVSSGAGAPAVRSSPSRAVQVLVAYDSLTGNTEQMARSVIAGVKQVEGAAAVLKKVSEVSKQDLEAADGIVLGCPTYYGNIPGRTKVVIDDWSWKMKVDFTDKAGGAFATGGGQVGGKEYVVVSLLMFMLNNRMVVAGPLYQNEKTGSVWAEAGAAAMTGPLDPGISQSELDGAARLGKRIALLARKLKAADYGANGEGRCPLASPSPPMGEREMSNRFMERLKLILFEDEHLLVINKPCGLNTHAPAPYAGEGIFDWLRHREPRWASLAILQRLDKETSGVMVFGKTTEANRALTDQFTRHEVRKKYLFLTDRPAPKKEFTVTSSLVRAGERYLCRPVHAGAETATTQFRVLETGQNQTMVEARPLTGRTHQIRVHAASQGLPILGDALYEGSPAPRLCLHAASLEFRHPGTGQPMIFEAPADFSTVAGLALRQALIDQAKTNAYRLIHGASDHWPGWYVERLGSHLLSQSEQPLQEAQQRHLEAFLKSSSRREEALICPAGEIGKQEYLSLVTSAATRPKAPVERPTGECLARGEPTASGRLEQQSVTGAYHKRLDRQVRRSVPTEASPEHLAGQAAPLPLLVRENGLLFELSFNEGYSTGLFLDQRDNRRRILTKHIAADFPLLPQGAGGARLLNTFAYTCSFSVAAARAGLRTTSLDLSKKYLEWGRRNFVLNGLDPAEHDFIYGEVFNWLRRLARKQRAFEVIVLDPPTFSQSREEGVFRAEKDYARLVTAAVPLLSAQGLLLASTNAARYAPEDFVADVCTAIQAAGRRIAKQHYAPQPPDFPVSRGEPAYLKTLWLRVE